MLGGIDTVRYQTFLDFLNNFNTEHTNASLLAHLVETSIVLNEWQRSETCIIAGLFHAIYNTQYNQSLVKEPPKRKQLQELIGKDAENLVYLFSTLDREKLLGMLESGDYSVYTKADMLDLVHVILANWYEQLPRIPQRIWIVEVEKTIAYLKFASPIARSKIINFLKQV